MSSLFSMIVISLGLFFLFSCGNNQNTPEGYTKVTFSKGKITAPDSIVQNAGLVLAGNSSDGQSFFLTGYDSSDSTIELTLPNGNWDFSSIGWQSRKKDKINEDTVSIPVSASLSSKMSGTARCASKASVALNGTDQSITLNMSADRCDHPIYGPSVFHCQINGFKPIRVVTCASDSIIPTSAAADCTSNLGVIRSVEIMIPTVVSPPLSSAQYGQFEDWNMDGYLPSFLTDSFKSRCIQVDANSSYVDTGIRIPLGDHSTANDHVFDPVIMAYTDASCGAIIGQNFTPYMLIDGVDGYNCRGRVLVLGDDTMATAFLFDQNATSCSDSDNGGNDIDDFETNFDVGDCLNNSWSHYGNSGIGTENSPYKLCTSEQIQSLQQASTSNNFVGTFFQMQGDIDMSTYGTGSGDTKIIGSSSYPFKGNFDGNNFQLHNISFAADRSSYVGLFGYLVGDYVDANQGVIKNIQLVDPQITFDYSCTAQKSSNRPHSFAGALVGYADSYSSITNSSVIGSGVNPKTARISIPSCMTSHSNVGGLVGYSNSAVIEDVESINTIVSGRDNVGGVIGTFYGSSCSTSVTKVIDAVNVEVSGTNNVGGIIGELSLYSNYTINDSLAENIIVTGSSNVGGLVGYANTYTWSGHTPSVIKNTYATGVVTADGTAGGLIGYVKDQSTETYLPIVSIQNTFVAVVVAGAGTNQRNAFIGLYGADSNNLIALGITNSFWDIEKVSTTYGISSNTNSFTSTTNLLVGLSTEVLKNETAFRYNYASDWNWAETGTSDSDTAWTYDGGNDNYPNLK